jgi:hypothetical protein
VVQDQRVSPDGEQTVYEPKRHEGTGVNEEEMLYESYLLPIGEALKNLRHSIMEDVVRKGWEAVELRMKIEDKKT